MCTCEKIRPNWVTRESILSLLWSNKSNYLNYKLLYMKLKYWAPSVWLRARTTFPLRFGLLVINFKPFDQKFAPVARYLVLCCGCIYLSLFLFSLFSLIVFNFGFYFIKPVTSRRSNIVQKHIKHNNRIIHKT